MYKTLPLALCLILCVTVVHAASPGELVDGVLVVINKDILLVSDLSNSVHSYMMQLERMPTEAELKQLTDEVFRQMVMTRVLVQEAERQGLSVTFRELERLVDAQLQEARMMYRTEEAFNEALAEVGLTEYQLEELYRNEARDQMLISQLMSERQHGRRVTVTEEEIDRYIREHQLGGEQVTVLKIRVISAAERPAPDSDAGVMELARELARRARAGEDFLDLAARYGRVRGDMGVRRIGELTPAFEQAAFALRPGEVSEPVVTEFGVHIIKMLERIDDSSAHLAQIQLALETGDVERRRAAEALGAVRHLLQAEPAAPATLTDYEDILEEQTVQFSLASLQGRDPRMAAMLERLSPGEMTEDIPYEGVLSLIQLLDRYQTDAADRDRVRQMIAERKRLQEQEQWLEELLGEAYIDVKSIEYRGILPPGPGRR